MLDVVTILVLFLALFNSNRRIAQKNPRMPGLKGSLDRLLVYHTIFIGIFTLYILNYGGDSHSYWQFERDLGPAKIGHWSDYFGLGTLFVEFLCYVPVKMLGLSYITGNCLFGSLGFLGIRYLYLLFRMTLPVNVEVLGIAVIPYIFYLPNLHFWVGGVGKDSICFFCIAWFLYCLQFFRRKAVGMAVSFLLLFFVRPHMGIMLIAGTLIGVLVSGRVKRIYKVLFAILIAVVFYFVYDIAAKYLRIEDLSADSLSSMALQHVKELSGKAIGSSLDLQNYSVPVRVFTYLFRPLFFDARDIMSLTISLENLIYLVITIMGLRSFRWKYLAIMPVWLKSGLIVFILTVIVFSNTLSNLGIVIRMKNMTMIYFLMTFVVFVSCKEKMIIASIAKRKDQGWPLKSADHG